MVEDTVAALNIEDDATIRIIDPFCGDGRLLVALLRALSVSTPHLTRIEVVGWDIDDSIIPVAESAIQEVAKSMPFEVEASVVVADAFFCDESQFGTFDICITNPPWSSTKSLKATAFNEMSEYRRYQELANAYGRLLVERYPEVKTGRSFGAGALNLSRFGMSLSLRMLNETGICSIVVPSSFAADTSTKMLRGTLLQHFHLCSLHYYPAELKLFKGADQAAIYLVATARQSDAEGSVVSHQKYHEKAYLLDETFWRYSKRNSWIIPIGYSDKEIRLIEKMANCPTLESIKSISLGREVDETRIGERLCDFSDYRFVKGFMINCYRLSDTEKWYYDPEKSVVPKSAMKEKVVWRDVSRMSQHKRVKATLLSPNHVAGNSLGVATCDDPLMLRALLGIMNSTVFEFMARTVLTTNHVSSGTLKRLPFPVMSEKTIAALAAAVDMALESPLDSRILEHIDQLVANAYSLSQEDLETARYSIKGNDQLAMKL